MWYIPFKEPDNFRTFYKQEKQIWFQITIKILQSFIQFLQFSLIVIFNKGTTFSKVIDYKIIVREF